MTAATVMQVQELCSHIAGFLVSDTSTDLRSTSLISRSLCAASQLHLFPTVTIVTAGGNAPSVARLQSVLESSPHLVLYIRRLEVPIHAGTLTTLASIRFSGLRAVGFRGFKDNCPMELMHGLTSRAPSLRKLTLNRARSSL
ncbi:hypothetical protein B0H17DRAFT_1221766 [Mycena rosella]|uniref:Uncharacterized protein n=1 Tax=Mycena rosella TaxID=1033263 RepID=A0AAD7B0B9_MYCRO|nr:hypothetical protein B0H17DRAFT_1221766 [Mycena rosella]